MRTSESINDLAAAFAKAQGQIENAKKDTANPFFKSKYADLASCWAACRLPLSDNGLSVPQFPRLVHETDEHWMVEVESYLLHSSGQFMCDVLKLPVSKLDAQGVGSAITYAKRYHLISIVGVAPDEDDDGEHAVGRGASAPTMHTVQRPTKPNGKPKPEAEKASEKLPTTADRTPDEIYQAGKASILSAKTSEKIASLRAGVQSYADEGKLDSEQAGLLLALLDKQQEKIDAKEPAAT